MTSRRTGPIFYSLFLGLVACGKGFEASKKIENTSTNGNPPQALNCLSTTRSVTSGPNSAGQTQICVATLPASSPSPTPVIANPVTGGGSYSLICQDNGEWAATPSVRTCPPPAVITCMATTRTIISAPNGSGQTQTCIANLPVSSPSTTPVVAAPVSNGGSYSLICKTNGQWAPTATSETCPKPADSSVAINWTTSPAINPTFVYPTAKTLTFSISPSGMGTPECFRAPGAQSGDFWASANKVPCTSGSSFLADREGNWEYGIQVINSSAQILGRSIRLLVNVDRVVPTFSIGDPPAISTDGKTYTFTLTPSEPISYVIYKLDGVVQTNAGVGLSYQATVTDYNQHTVEFRVADLAGNLSSPISKSFQRTPATLNYQGLKYFGYPLVNERPWERSSSSIALAILLLRSGTYSNHPRNS